MRITFLGGTETVTGSKFLVESGETKILVDCGLFQGYKWLRERNWQPLPLDIDKLDAIVLTHAHLDHSGYIPVMYQHGYRHPVFTHSASKDLCSILLPDSGHIQEQDAEFYARHKLSKHAKPEPLYDRATAERSMELFKTVEFGETFSIGDLTLYLQGAGHILGAGSLIIEVEGKRIGFSGDVGRSNDILMKPPEPLPELDLLLMESTYGDRRHSDIDPFDQLTAVVNETAQNGGILLIPSFAVGRAQALQHLLAVLKASGRIPALPVYLDSPMAISVADIYCHYARYHRLSSAQCHDMCEIATYTRSVEESKALADLQYPHIIIAGSGMATGGRILHHFKRLLRNHRTTVLFTGFQAGGTRGAKMLAGAETVKIHGDWIPVKARIEVIHGLSGHADYVEMQDWLRRSKLKKNTAIKLVHGEPDALEAMRDHLRQTTAYDVEIADYRSILRL
ncbi:MBL fold metallo-hydrolase RNA specificity domain-containing protein [Methylophaga sp. OBS4]|uniref:MBL fold metallo-hydrolase RNA specificity domain-containing protein n=1 Tax=Methylophaga sp. OBS4 TaxID=2991935 RepID=UPI0022527635|nr:MBL fold metallo-hydrolase [Methylophaga sp. OBS4]MCX4186270.1 MBL fold metallo-hydrolase [Methylophaga sp. OBS4]